MHSRRLTLVALLCAVSTPAAAWSLAGWDWSWQSQPMSDPFFINDTSFPASVGSNAEVRDALENGMARWALEGGALFSFNYGGTTTNSSFGGGGVHIAQYFAGSISGATLAVAQSDGFGPRMEECDIRFYASNDFGPIAWSADPRGAPVGFYDLEQSATHEFGHCAGLAHSNNVDAVMYGSTTSGIPVSNRWLHPDDMLGLQAMYGAAVGSDLNLSVLDPIVAGTTVRVEVSGAPSRTRVRLALGGGGVGDGPCYAALGGRCADVLAPITLAGSSRSNGNGVAIVDWDIPNTLSGLDIGLQAVVIQGAGGASTLMSNAFGGLVLGGAATCAPGESLDCGGNCWDDSWLGDGFCDDGTMHSWGNPHFSCAQYNFDEGDCAP